MSMMSLDKANELWKNYKPALEISSKTSTRVIKELADYLVGNSHSLYSDLQLNTEEKIFLFENIVNSNIEDIFDVKSLVSKSFLVGGPGDRVFILNPDARLEFIMGFDILNYSTNDGYINTSIFIESNPFQNANIIFLFLEICKYHMLKNLCSDNINIFSISDILDQLYNSIYSVLSISTDNINKRVFIMKAVESLLKPLVSNININNSDRNIITKYFKNINRHFTDEYINGMIDYCVYAATRDYEDFNEWYRLSTILCAKDKDPVTMDQDLDFNE